MGHKGEHLSSSRSPRLPVIGRPSFWLYILAVFAAAGTSFYLTVRKGETPRPRLEMPEFDTTDLGEGKVGQVLTGTFSFRNWGSAPLDFKLQTTCACSELSPMEGRLQPGETQLIRAGIRLRYRGRREVAAIHVHTNDPDFPTAVHTVFARNVVPFVVSPAAVDFGTVADDGKPRTASLRVLGPEGQPLPAHVTVSAASDSPHLLVHPDETQPGERSFRVTLQKGVPRGHFAGSVTLRVSNDEAPYEVPVTAQLRGLVSFAPQTVYLPRTAGPGQEFSILAWRTDGRPLGKLIGRQVPEGITVEKNSDEAAVRQRLKIAVKGSWDPAGPCWVRLRFEGAPEDVVIEVRPRDAPQAASGPPAGDQSR